MGMYGLCIYTSVMWKISSSIHHFAVTFVVFSYIFVNYFCSFCAGNLINLHVLLLVTLTLARCDRSTFSGGGTGTLD